MKIRTTALTTLTLAIWSGTAAAQMSNEELQRLVLEQQATIEQLLENQQQQARELEALRAFVAPSGSTDTMVASAPTAPEAQADITTSPSGLNVSLGAHVNRAVNIVDDGATTDAYFVDSGNYPTLLYVMGSNQVSDDLSVMAHVEYAIQNNAQTSVSQDNQEAGLETSSRFFEIVFDHKRYGKLWTGRGFMSSFLAVELDKSETWRYNLLSPGNSFGGMKFVDASDNSLTDIQVLAAFLDVEAFSFRDRIRYDSPSFNGFQVSGSVGTGNSGDVTLRYNGNIGDIAITAAGSWQNNPLAGRIDDRIDGGVALLHEPSGFNLSIIGVRQDFVPSFYQQFGRTEGRNTGAVIRAGMRRQLFDAGETRFAVDYSRSEDVLWQADSADSFGIFGSQMFDSLGLELYGGYRFYKLDVGPNAGGLSLKDMHGVSIGARLLFDSTFRRQ